MNKTTKRIGRIIVPRGVLVQPHELMTATALSWTGDDVEFLLPTFLKTADIRFRRLIWEIKSPLGSSSRTIENNIRNATKQSKNIIIDLYRIKQPEEKCLKEIRKQKELRKLKHIIVVTKKRDVIEL